LAQCARAQGRASARAGSVLERSALPDLRLHAPLLGTRASGPDGGRRADSNIGQFQKGDNKLKQSTKDKLKGKLHEVKGSVKQKTGQITGNPRLQSEGANEKVAGKIQSKIGQVERVFEQ